jgi:hypothetical protein
MRRALFLGLLAAILGACATAPRPAPVLLSPQELHRLSGTWRGTIRPEGTLAVLTDMIVTTDRRFTSPGRIYRW